MTRTLYLIRHCTTTGQEPEAPLTEAGFEQAARLAEWLADRGIEAVVSSPYVRAVQSIQPFADRHGISIQQDPRLRERDLSSEPLSDVRKHLAATFEDFDLCLPGGESTRTAMARAAAALEEILQRPERTVAVVSHGNLTTLMLRHFDDTVGFETGQRLTNPDVYVVTLPPDGPSTVLRAWE